MITLDDLLALPKGTNIAYKRQRWVLKSWQTVGIINEPVFESEDGEILHDVIFIPHLITVLEEK